MDNVIILENGEPMNISFEVIVLFISVGVTVSTGYKVFQKSGHLVGNSNVRGQKWSEV